MTILALYFDGTSASGHPVSLTATGDQLELSGDTIMRRYKRSACRMDEPFDAAPCMLELPDGSHCEAPATASAALAELMRYAPTRIERWQSRWAGALAAVVAMAGIVAFAYFQGVPALSAMLVERMPVSAETQLGDAAQAEFDQLLHQSHYSADSLAQIAQVFERVRPNAKRMPVRLQVYHAPHIGANAFALPNGTIVITDELIDLLYGDRHVRDSEKALAAILAHEIGHIEHRHSIRGLARSSLLLAGSWTLFGDFSTVTASLPALVGKMRYSREMEFEADAFAGDALARAGLQASALADALAALERYHYRNPEEEANLPESMRNRLGFLSSHPATAERIERLKATD